MTNMLNNSSSYPIRSYGYKKVTIDLENPRVDDLAILWRLFRNNEDYLSSDETYKVFCNSWEITVNFPSNQSIIRKPSENGQLYPRYFKMRDFMRLKFFVLKTFESE